METKIARATSPNAQISVHDSLSQFFVASLRCAVPSVACPRLTVLGFSKLLSSKDLSGGGWSSLAWHSTRLVLGWTGTNVMRNEEQETTQDDDDDYDEGYDDDYGDDNGM